MVSFTRTDAWKDGGTFANRTLLWYARGVGQLQSRDLDDQNSWWFFAAIHGEYLSDTSFPGWKFIPGPPQVPTTPLPITAISEKFWNQCQHQSWYFPPWHRGYILALEAQIREAIVSLGGPDTWALPYWNYFGLGNEFMIPPAFTDQSLPDGSPNPLFVKARYGPNNDGNIFVAIPPVSQSCQSNNIYTGSSVNTPSPGYGGPDTGFWHGGGPSGNLESNPHNLVHVDIGGDSPNDQTWGLMSDPGLAALDPIFYLHHCNIDRMWASWNAMGNKNPTDPNWLDGPIAVGDRQFIMPMPGGSDWSFTPMQVNSLSLLDYTYDDLPAVPAPPVLDMLNRRLRRLGAPPASQFQGADVNTKEIVELVGAHDSALQILSSGARATVRLDPAMGQRVSASLAEASESSLPDRIYLQLDNVTGTRDAHKLSVYVNGHDVGTIALFGLRRASLKDGRHGGNGLIFDLDITDVVDNLFLDNMLDVDSLDVRILPSHAIPADADISIGRISVYRQGHR